MSKRSITRKCGRPYRRQKVRNPFHRHWRGFKGTRSDWNFGTVKYRKPPLPTHKPSHDVSVSGCQLQHSPCISADCKQATPEKDGQQNQTKRQNSNAHKEPSVDIELDYSVFTCISNRDDTDMNTISEGRTLNISEQDVTVDSSSDSTVKHPVPTVLQESKRNSLGFAFGQKLFNMFHTTKNSCRPHPEASKKILSVQKPVGTSESAIQPSDDPHSKGDRVATPVGHLRPWPPAMQFQQQQNPRTDSQEDPMDLTVSAQILLKQHNANLLQSLKDATVRLARKDMEMQRLISVNSQLGERYSRMRGQYLELAREQARLRQRYDMLLVRGLDREQLHESNTNLEGQMEQLRTQLAESEERVNQLNRQLARVELEAKDTAQSAATAEVRLSQLQAELERKDVQLRAQTCRKFMEAARELQARAILNELLELKGNIRVMIRCYSDSEGRNSIYRMLNEDTLVVKPFLNATGGCHPYTSRKGAQAFHVYRVFPPGATQRAVFDEVRELVLSCIDGYSASILAYGQSGSGKTYTMLGAPSKPGIIPRVARLLITECHSRAPLWTYRISVAMLQVHKDNVTDLLAEQPSANSSLALTRVSLHDNGKQILLKGVREVEVSTEMEFMEELRPLHVSVGTIFEIRAVEEISATLKARSRRQATAAALNTSTTYLHFVLILRVRGLSSGALIGKENKTRTEINQPRPISPASPVSHELYTTEDLDSRLRLASNEEPGSIGLTTRMATHGLLVLADLAGFDGWNPGQNRSNPLSTVRQSRQPLMTIANKEQERRSKALPHNNCAADADAELNETKQLGKSLITLGRVFDAMVGGDGSGKHHIPYRDSKLTHLLKPALCGDARCMLIVTLNTHQSCFEASMRSLKLAARASKISTGKVKRNAAICGGIRTSLI